MRPRHRMPPTHPSLARLTVPRPPADQAAFDPSAVAQAARRFADILVADPGVDAVDHIEVTLCGGGPIDRLFAVEAALAAAWPGATRRPAQRLASSTGEHGANSRLVLRALGRDGAELLRRVSDLETIAPVQA